MTINSFYIGPSPFGLLDTQNWFGAEITTVQVHMGPASWDDWFRVDLTQERYKNQAVDIMWSVPLVPKGADLASAAAGLYNDKYLKLAEQLMAAYGDKDQIYVRLGWEFNGDWNSSSAIGQPENYVAAFRQFVDIFRSISDKFVFEWTPNIGDVGMNPETAYPGDKYVDVVGIDFYYDSRWDSSNPYAAFNYFVSEPYGLAWQQSFAAKHGKPTAIGEWGLDYDSPEFVQLVAKWVKDHGMLYQNYWNTNSAFPGSLIDGSHPKAAEAFRLAFGAITTVQTDTLSNPNKTGADVLHGTLRADTMTGGDGDDVYYVNTINDRVIEYYHGGKGGTDTVYSSVSYTLSANVERLTLTGYVATNGTGNGQANFMVGNDASNMLRGLGGADRIYGGGGHDKIDGGEGDDRLYGQDGNDTLDGGIGADMMDGGDGNDLYFVDNAGDKVVEWHHNGLGGVDTVKSTISYTLVQNVENLTLLGTADVNGTGNGADNAIIGNEGANLLRGLGGNDTLEGGAGNDKIYGDDGNDSLFGGAGMDLLEGGKGSDILHGERGDDRVNGGDGDDSLYGETGNDILDGGAGADFMDGGDGDDTYYVDNVGDTILEWHHNGLGGLDAVYASIDYVLGANVENLFLTGSGNIAGTGTSAANCIVGNSANNVITGLGGDDVLAGGGGADKFAFGLWSGRDVITDFGVGDSINLANWLAAGRTPTVSMVGNDTVITLSNTDSIMLTGVASSHLHATSTGYDYF